MSAIRPLARGAHGVEICLTPAHQPDRRPPERRSLRSGVSFPSQEFIPHRQGSFLMRSTTNRRARTGMRARPVVLKKEEQTPQRILDELLALLKRRDLLQSRTHQPQHPDGRPQFIVDVQAEAVQTLESLAQQLQSDLQLRKANWRTFQRLHLDPLAQFLPQGTKDIFARSAAVLPALPDDNAKNLIVNLATLNALIWIGADGYSAWRKKTWCIHLTIINLGHVKIMAEGIERWITEKGGSP